MNLAIGHIAARSEADLADLVARKLAIVIARHAQWREIGGAMQPGSWRGQFAEWCRDDPAAQEWAEQLYAVQQRLKKNPVGAIRRRLAALFRLEPAELDLLDCALAISAESAFEADLKALFPGANGLEDNVVAALFGYPNQPIARASSALIRWSLVERGPMGLAIDPDIAGLLCGRPGLDRVLAQCASVIEPANFTVPNWPVGAVAEAAMRLTEMARPVRVMIQAAPGAGRQLFAAAVATQLSSRVLRIDPALASESDDVAMRSQRLALLTGHALFWNGAYPQHAPGIAQAPLQFVALGQGENCLPVDGISDLWVELPPLDPTAREQVWSQLTGSNAAVSPIDCGRLGSAARLGDLMALAQQAPQSRDAAREVLARRMRTRISGTGNILPLPYSRSDLVLAGPASRQFDTIISELSRRERVLAEPALAQRYARLGQSILIHGPSGTGKTMAAQVLAAELGCELVRVDCSSIISKYIGETAKLLRGTFEALHGSGAIALFDEADALFAKRTELKDSNDRHANSDTNYLLQLIEEFDEIAILATNRKENVDPAFLRRMRYVIEFGELGPAARAELWSHHLLAVAGAGVGADWAERLALIELTPAQIKGAALNALFIGNGDSAGIGQFVRGIERELAKDSRAIDQSLKRKICDA